MSLLSILHHCGTKFKSLPIFLAFFLVKKASFIVGIYQIELSEASSFKWTKVVFRFHGPYNCIFHLNFHSLAYCVTSSSSNLRYFIQTRLLEKGKIKVTSSSSDPAVLSFFLQTYQLPTWHLVFALARMLFLEFHAPLDEITRQRHPRKVHINQTGWQLTCLSFIPKFIQ